MNKAYQNILSVSHRYYIRQKAVAERHFIPATAVIDTGIFPHHVLSGKIVDFFDTVDHRTTPYDNNGHGTHIAGIISGRGIFPQGTLIGIKSLNENGSGKISNFIEGTEYLMKNRHKHNLRVINISLGTKFDGSSEHQALIDCVEHAWDCGMIICAAAGNNGPQKGSVTVPGISKKVITVGTSDDNVPVSTDTGSKIIHYSGRGPTAECVIKPDILCPGANILSLNNSPSGYSMKSGTSMSTPMISGAIALLLYVHPDLSPKEVKMAVKMAHRKNQLTFEPEMFFQNF